VLLTGASLILEFAALVALRVSEPGLARPFRVPGAFAGAVALGVCPTLLLGFSVVHSETERVLGMNGLVFGVLLILAGFLAYWAATSGRSGISPAGELAVTAPPEASEP
jgi:hypothetical protein